MPVIAKFNNTLIKALNSDAYLPHYLIVFPDKDILEGLKYFSYSVKMIIKKHLTWLITQI